MTSSGNYWLCSVLVLFSLLCVHGRNIASQRPVKTIKTEYGDVVDCIDFYKQPAFNHPLLKDLKIKMEERPKGYTVGSVIENLPTVDCPEGTVAILRTKIDNSSKSPLEFKGKIGTAPGFYFNDPATMQDAYVSTQKGSYTGVKALVNMWNPKVLYPEHEASGGYIWIQSGEEVDADLNYAGCGWTVNPQVYGDGRTRFTSFWTVDNSIGTGCVDTKCGGFVTMSSKYYLGMPFVDVSHYQSTQIVNRFKIFRGTPPDDKWYVAIGKEVLGFWPTDLFPRMGDNAEKVAFGGRLVDGMSPTDRARTPSEMGSGRVAKQGYGKSAYMRELVVVNDQYADTYVVSENLEHHASFQQLYGPDNGKIDDGSPCFYYGGPNYQID